MYVGIQLKCKALRVECDLEKTRAVEFCEQRVREELTYATQVCIDKASILFITTIF